MPTNREAFFRRAEEEDLDLTYDDVLLKPGYSEVLPSEVNVAGFFSTNVRLQAPIASSPMDTVTDEWMAIAMAELGGLGIIHPSMKDQEQADQVGRVKKYRQGMVKKPETVLASDTMAEVRAMQRERKLQYHSFPVLAVRLGPVVGLLTRKHFELWGSEPSKRIGDIMEIDPLSAVPETDREAAYELMRDKGKTRLLLRDDERRLAGMYVFSDLERIRQGSANPMNVDGYGRLRVGAAVTVSPSALDHAKLLIANGVDVIVVDSSHGDHVNVHKVAAQIIALDQVDVVVGNISTYEAAERLVKLGAAGLRVGNGPGSICTTRLETGCGSCQLSAVNACARGAQGRPVIADGGIKCNGDLTKAFAAGASSVMIGSMLAGTEESCGLKIELPSGTFKEYRGMGSAEAMAAAAAARERYSGKRLPEGVPARVRYKGPVALTVQKMVDGLRGGMGYCGAESIPDLQAKAQFRRITASGQRESHPHDVILVKEEQ